MFKKFYFHNLLFVVLIILFLPNSLLSNQISTRYFDSAPATSDSVRLTILYPVVDNIKTLVNLKEKGLIDIDKLIVIGVYHEKEFSDYQASIKMIDEGSIDWIKFHQLSGDISGEKLYQKNELTSDFELIFSKSDGMIFFGGADIPPRYYGNKTNLLTRIYTPYRHAKELSFIFHLLGGHQNKDFKPLLDVDPSFPILGICLGEQSLNVGTGGTLVQDIWAEIYGIKYFEDVLKLSAEKWHSNPWSNLYPREQLPGYNMHRIKFIKNEKFITDLDFIKTDQPYVISYHHQMVGRKGKGVKVIATSLDGKVVEAIGFEDYPNVLGVQFHPEAYIFYDKSTQYRISPKDKTNTDFNPPDAKFHEKFWEWFSHKLKESHANR